MIPRTSKTPSTSQPFGVKRRTGESSLGEEVHQVEEPRPAGAGVDGVGEGVEPPPAVGAVHVPEVDALGVAEADDLGRLEPASRWVAGRQVEVGVVAGEQSGRVVRGQSGGELAVGDELALDLGERGHGGLGVVRVDPPGSADRLRPPGVRRDEVLGDLLAFLGVGVEQRRRAASLQHGRELPPEVERVLHGHVHALTGLRGVGVAGVPGDEDARRAGAHLVVVHVVELVGHPCGRPGRPRTTRSPGPRACTEPGHAGPGRGPRPP